MEATLHWKQNTWNLRQESTTGNVDRELITVTKTGKNDTSKDNNPTGDKERMAEHIGGNPQVWGMSDQGDRGVSESRCRE